ncbi:hypothetical protein Patl1_06399 [Pistacia atlantica]|uniref:Uncharacterized protein n=1 Tax=Pistacia atlantica TaxID=434234 RepID=A0ACC1BRX3_9ROSI|nr:hypothetical protein Patl1_06399 [Pistacia atlantica]
MGCCWSFGVKTESTLHAGTTSKYGNRDGNGLIGSSSKVSSVSVPRTEGEILQSSNLKSFSFNELRTATRNFRPDSVLGEGGFGSVFKGWIDEHTFAATKPGTGIVIAVKRLNQEGFQGHQEWLVRGSYFQPLSWNLRMKVALGAAKGLAFLHSDEAKVIYRDFKTSNILLDSNYSAKLSDFGLAKDGPTGNASHVSTRVMGTYGYAAPEYMATGIFSSSSQLTLCSSQHLSIFHFLQTINFFHQSPSGCALVDIVPYMTQNSSLSIWKNDIIDIN